MTMREKMAKICENDKAAAMADKILSDARERNIEVIYADVVDYVYERFFK